jgi:hypothetical protein
MKKVLWFLAELLLAILVMGSFIYFGLKTSPLYGW